MLRLSDAISSALEAGDLRAAAKAQREMRQLQLDRPSATCQHLIAEDCRRATSLLRQGDAVTASARIRAVKKLGRWLRWQRFGSKGLVPPHIVIEGMLQALRSHSKPEVAWAAQCALFHAARSADGNNRSVREGPRGIISRLLLTETIPFPLCLPDLSDRALRDFQRALETQIVRDFFGQLKSLTLIDPGYGDDPEFEDLDAHATVSKAFGRSFQGLETLALVGFEDVAMALFLPHLKLPKLESLRVVGSLQTPVAQRALVSTLVRYGPHLNELALNVWSEFLYEAQDPLMLCGRMPRVRRLTVRAPPTVPWEHLAATFPALEQLTFLYDSDFALNSIGLLEDRAVVPEDALREHAAMLYRDAAIFARDFHLRGVRKLERDFANLKEVRFAVTDTSFGIDDAPGQGEECPTLAWRRDFEGADLPTSRLRRDDVQNNRARKVLSDKSVLAVGRGHAFAEEEEEEAVLDEGHYHEVTQAEAEAAGAAVMLQVLRLFDDPSLERAFRTSTF